MGYSKANEFSLKDKQLARIAKALSHPARIAIIKLLLKKRACICGDIVDVLPLSQATVSQHLKELKDAGLIKGEIDGPRICYCIDERKWRQSEKSINGFFQASITALDKCC
ncbi:MAG TPA: metalloregulator ArsR/SmtB family transcription factor [Saprospiraceae bacterium]|nr:metalloregulator ArsR/SmtB family transcription factor [Saprospiraceae bacterium]HQW55897.1 metalloregulator ArsR/SmtB family transcription factor [Saprospiraceae bacterium]